MPTPRHACATARPTAVNMDPDTGELTRLFHPAPITGPLTAASKPGASFGLIPVGRTSVSVLKARKYQSDPNFLLHDSDTGHTLGVESHLLGIGPQLTDWRLQ